MASAQVRRQLQVAELDRSSSNSVVQWPACPSQTIASPPFRDASYADLPTNEEPSRSSLRWGHRCGPPTTLGAPGDQGRCTLLFFNLPYSGAGDTVAVRFVGSGIEIP